MMRRLLLALSVALTSLTAAPVAAQNATVVELYTSQGCSSCPPADAMLAQMVGRDDLIPLALHVDYWDYLGWKDDLASPAYTQRQHNYAAAANARTVYTPQMVIGGTDMVVGSRTMQVMDLVQAHQARPDPVTLNLTRSGDTLNIVAEAAGPARNTVVQLVRYAPSVTRDIRRGENAGRSIEYVNAVTAWDVLDRWNTGQPLRMRVAISGSNPVVVIVQDGTNGPILGAAQLR